MLIRPGVAAGHPVTAAAGADILAAGGSAADAAVAMVLVGCAAETIFTGLGGGGFATHFDAASGEVSCHDFFVDVPGLEGATPRAGMPITVSFVGQQLPYDVGPATVAVPGVPAGAFHLWRRFGRLGWEQVVGPGLRASRGTPFPARHAQLLPDIAPAMLIGDGAYVYGRPGDQLLQAGERLWHPEHHRAYELLARDPAAFYTGDFAAAAVAAVAEGGMLDATDLRSYTVREQAPRVIETSYGTFAARGDDLDDVLGTLDRATAGVHHETTGDPESALALVAALRGPERRAETSNVVAVDAQGDACVVTTSLGLGSGVWVPGYGVHLNSMLGEGELVRARLHPGERMGSMMSPLVGRHPDGTLLVAAGAAGGSRIRPALVQVLLRILAGHAPQAAIELPRLNALPGLVRCEPGFSPAVLAALVDAGDEVVVAPGPAPYFGGVTAVGRRGAGADPRRGGAALVL
jgi:gamma-glutamyltranspeptidase/glutathione hydrolase